MHLATKKARQEAAKKRRVYLDSGRTAIREIQTWVTLKVKAARRQLWSALTQAGKHCP